MFQCRLLNTFEVINIYTRSDVLYVNKYAIVLPFENLTTCKLVDADNVSSAFLLCSLHLITVIYYNVKF